MQGFDSSNSKGKRITNFSIKSQVLRLGYQEKYIKIKKKFVKKKPKTLCQLTEKGRQAFVEYIDNLEEIIKNVPGMKEK